MGNKKGLNYSNWSIDENLEGMKFFAEIQNEMLFHYTIDSYRAYTFNSHTLINELNDVLKEVINGFIDAKALIPIIEEINNSTKNDFVIRAILNNKSNVLSKLLETIKNLASESNRQDYYKFEKYVVELESFCSFLDYRYFAELKSQIVNIMQNPKEKDKIIQLSQYLIPELIFAGFSKEYIYSKNKDFFFGQNSINNISQIKDFIKFFENQDKYYEVSFKVNSDFCNFTDKLLEGFKIYISKECPKVNTPTWHYNEFTRLNEGYSHFLTIKEIIAKDPYSARTDGEKYLDQLFDFIRYFIHDSKCSWDNYGLCIFHEINDEENKDFFVARPSISPMLKIKDDKDTNEALMKSIRLFVHLDSTSIYRLYNSLNLHSCAISSETPENQLISLWTALETLLPPPGNSKARITHFVSTMYPILGRDYIIKLITDLIRNIYLYLEKDKVQTLFSLVETNYPELYSELQPVEKCSLLIILYNNDSNIKKEINEVIGDNVLLRNRFYAISQILKDTNSIKEKIESHNNRVKWHLQRIYRARNLITHKGEGLAYVSDLLENTHNYYHTIIDLIIKTQKEHNNQFKNIGSIFNFIKMEHELHLDSLKEKQDITKENYKKYVLGEE
ncbi:hypothetical protein L1994_00905 [Methanomicrobium antiquum]|uniref:Apea-like HEPN domain-containing protein n=1 Tax=Methanomicrobium antiquum TaxID=487686 RepID=A0AAF0JN16_9EURY|nr:hypothetical protein [Methanomicrobium antiquum]WFN36986.1 hypothetical protein L1994_00905 [Methanomicrobium antiquum]